MVKNGENFVWQTYELGIALRETGFPVFPFSRKILASRSRTGNLILLVRERGNQKGYIHGFDNCISPKILSSTISPSSIENDMSSDLLAQSNPFFKQIEEINASKLKKFWPKIVKSFCPSNILASLSMAINR